MTNGLFSKGVILENFKTSYIRKQKKYRQAKISDGNIFYMGNRGKIGRIRKNFRLCKKLIFVRRKKFTTDEKKIFKFFFTTDEILSSSVRI